MHFGEVLQQLAEIWTFYYPLLEDWLNIFLEDGLWLPMFLRSNLHHYHMENIHQSVMYLPIDGLCWGSKLVQFSQDTTMMDSNHSVSCKAEKTDYKDGRYLIIFLECNTSCNKILPWEITYMYNI